MNEPCKIPGRVVTVTEVDNGAALCMEAGDGAYFCLSDLTPVEAPAFKFGDPVTVDGGRRCVVLAGPGDFNDYRLSDGDDCELCYMPTQITPGWPETETEGEGQ